MQHNGDLSNEQLIRETMQKAPKKCHSTIANETRNQGNNLTLDHLSCAMMALWRLNTDNTNDSNDNKEASHFKANATNAKEKDTKQSIVRKAKEATMEIEIERNLENSMVHATTVTKVDTRKQIVVGN